jgi:hypothetical protein
MDNSFKKLSSANASVIMEGLDEIGKEVSNGLHMALTFSTFINVSFVFLYKSNLSQLYFNISQS